MTDLTLLRPEWLLALPLLLALALLLVRRQGQLGDWSRAADPTLLAALTTLNRVRTRSHRQPLFAALGAAGVIALALTGPAVERRDSLSYRNLDGVLFVLDASRSVTESERWPQLLTTARFAIAALGTRPGGLIVFAGDAYVASDLTLDHLQLGQTVSLVDAETVPNPGSRPARGLALSDRLLAKADVLAGDVILLTDGAGLGPQAQRAARALAEQNARVSVITLAGASPEAIALAAAGGGRAFTVDDIDAVSAWLTQDARTRLERQVYPLLFWRDFGRYLLLLALLPVLLLFRRRIE